MPEMILVTGDSVNSHYLEQLKQEGFIVKNPQQFLHEDELIKELQGCKYHLCGGDEKVTDNVLAHCPDLKLYSFLGVGYSSFIDEAAATNHGVAIASTPGTLTNTVAEFIIGLLLTSNRQIVSLNARTKHGDTSAEKLLDVEGKTVGILGMGSIGTEVGRRLNACFNATIIYNNRSPKSELPSGMSAEFVSLADLCARSDIIVVTISGDPENYDLVGQDLISSMKVGVQIVSIARAAVISPQPLLEAIKSRKVGTFALDGYYIEPIPSPDSDPYGFLSLPDDQFIITPHIASLTHNARDRMSDMCVKSIVNFERSNTDEFIVNPSYANSV